MLLQCVCVRVRMCVCVRAYVRDKRQSVIYRMVSNSEDCSALLSVCTAVLCQLDWALKQRVTSLLCQVRPERPMGALCGTVLYCSPLPVGDRALKHQVTSLLTVPVSTRTTSGGAVWYNSYFFVLPEEAGRH